MTDFEAPLPSPGVGARRKGPKSLPRLPLSAFSPPNSGTSERFPLPPSPSTSHPSRIVDGNLSVKNGLGNWKSEVGQLARRGVDGIVLVLSQASEATALAQIANKHPSAKIISAVVPIDLNQGIPAQVPTFGTNVKVSLSVRFVQNTAKLVDGVKWALQKGYVVDIDVQTPVTVNGEGWEGLEELLTAIYGSDENDKAQGSVGLTGNIVLSNVLPPPHDLSISIVKLLNHPQYNAYQSNTAALSLYPSVYIKYTPPSWSAPTPTTHTSEDSKEKKEWKRRIKMFLGPAIEAFGFQRIIYGSSGSNSDGDSESWYEIARESLAELGADQEGMDAVFGGNASGVYGV